MNVAHGVSSLVGSSCAIQELRCKISAAAAFDEPVLVIGETGVGKELVARALHAESARSSRPLQIINCAGVSPELLASEMFGHRSGAFTGAARSRQGRLRAADGSVVVLDEISETSERFQATLLRTIETGEIQPLGSDTVAHVDVRFVATTNHSMSELVSGDCFRRDLFYRLAGIIIEIAPLRDRLEDLPELTAYFLALLEQRYGRPRRLSEGALSLLEQQEYPGNVRELRQVLTRAYGSSEAARIGPSEVDAALFPAQPCSRTTVETGDLSLEGVVRRHLQRTLALADHNISQAARLLSIPRSTLQHYLTKYRIEAPAQRAKQRAAARS